MSHLKSEASAKRAGVQQAEQNVDTWVRGLEMAANREFTEFFGDDVARVLSTPLNSSLDSTEGGFRWLVSNAEGIEDLNPLRFAYDPDGALKTWKGIADLSNAVMNPASLAAMARANPQAFEALLKAVARTSEWSTDRPMLGASQNILDLLTLPFAAGKAGEAGEIAAAAGRAGESGGTAGDAGGIAGKLGEAGEAGRTVGVFGNISKETPQITKTLDDIAAGKPVTVDPLAGGRPLPAPDASPGPVVKPATDAPAAPRSLPSEVPRPPAPLSVHNAPIPVEHTPQPLPAASATAPGSPLDSVPSGGAHGGGTAGAPPPSASAHASAPIVQDHPLGTRPPAGGGISSIGRTHSGQNGDHQVAGDGHDGGATRETHRSELGSTDHSSESRESSGEGLDQQQRDAILAMEKGTRPDPVEYLSPQYIEQHLQRFDEGATRFMTADNLEAFGIGQRDGTTFVFPRSELDSLMASTGGDRSRLEQALGLPEGYFASYDIVRVDIPDPRDYELRIPSGNEAGANDKWIPGGFLPEGMPEAVIDGANVPSDDLVITDMSQ